MNAYKQVTSWGHIDWLQSKNRDSSMQAEIGIVNLLPRKRQAEHTHYSEVQFLYTLEGHGEHIVDGRSHSLSARRLLFSPLRHHPFHHQPQRYDAAGADVLRPLSIFRFTRMWTTRPSCQPKRQTLNSSAQLCCRGSANWPATRWTI